MWITRGYNFKPLVNKALDIGLTLIYDIYAEGITWLGIALGIANTQGTVEARRLSDSPQQISFLEDLQEVVGDKIMALIKK